jgi:hypothetical protein
LGFGLVLVLGFRLVLGSQSYGGDTKTPPRDQHYCDRGSSKLACRQQSNPRPILPVVENTPKLGRKNGKLRALKWTGFCDDTAG